MTVLLRIPLAAAVGLVLLLAAALVGRAPDQGALAAAGAWSLAALYAAVGAAGGALLGLLGVAGRGLDACATALRERLQQAAAARTGTRWSAAELRARYDELVDRMVAESVGRLPLPGMVRRWFRRQVRRAVLGDFVDALERGGGAASAGAGDVAGFLLGRGLTLALEPAHAWLRLWRTTVAVGLALLAALPLAARILG